MTPQQLAEQAHAGQTRKSTGEPYITHPERVASMFATDFFINVSWLHDVIEDTDYEFEDLEDFYGLKLAHTVHALTKHKGQQYSQYIRRISFDSRLALIKLADMFANLTDNPTEKQKEKYLKHAPKLFQAIEAEL